MLVPAGRTAAECAADEVQGEGKDVAGEEEAVGIVKEEATDFREPATGRISQTVCCLWVT